MPITYESREFSEELKKRVNANTEFREKAKGVTWKIMTIVADIPFATLSSHVDGELVERRHVPSAEIEAYKKQSGFIVEIPTYELSVEMAAGKHSLESLFMSGKLKVEGSIFKAMKYRDALGIVGKITTELTDQSIIPTKEEFMQTLRQRELL